MSFLLASFWYSSTPPVQASEPDGVCSEIAAVIDEYIEAGGDITFLSVTALWTTVLKLTEIIEMVMWTSTTIVSAVIGLVGILSTGVILAYAFKRNRTGTGKYQ